MQNGLSKMWKILLELNCGTYFGVEQCSGNKRNSLILLLDRKLMKIMVFVTFSVTEDACYQQHKRSLICAAVNTY